MADCQCSVCLFGPLPGTPAILSGREGWGEPVAVRRYEAVDGISQDWTIPPEVLSLRVPAGAERMSMMMSERIGVPALLASVAADPDDEDDAEDEDDDDSDGGDDRMEFPGRDE